MATMQHKNRWIILLAIALVWGAYNLSEATDSLSRTNTLQTQNTFTTNDDANCGGWGGSCQGTISDGGITIQINGGAFNFHICGAGMDGRSINGNEDRPCRVTPPAIMPGADTQIGTGLNPIVVNDDGFSNVRFGGETNDPIPSGSSDVSFLGLLIHGPFPGAVTQICSNPGTCGANVDTMKLTHFQSFRSVPLGQEITPGGAICAGAGVVRCTHIDFTVDQVMAEDQFGGRSRGEDAPFVSNYIVDSKTDINGNIISAGGSFTQTSENSDGTGTFTVDTSTPGFPGPTAQGFVDMSNITGSINCGFGVRSVDPFHQNGQVCQ